MKRLLLLLFLFPLLKGARADEALLIVGEHIIKSEAIVLAKRRHSSPEFLQMELIDVWRNTTTAKLETGYLVPVINRHYGACMSPVNMDKLDTVVLFLKKWKDNWDVVRTSVLPEQRNGKIMWDWRVASYEATPKEWRSAIMGMQEDWHLINGRVMPKLLCSEAASRSHGDFSKWHFTYKWKCLFKSAFENLKVNEQRLTASELGRLNGNHQSERIVVFPEERAVFQGDFQAFQELLYDSLKILFPDFMKNIPVIRNGIFKATITTTGIVSEVEVEKSVHPRLDGFISTFLKRETSWNPAKDAGNDVISMILIPIRLDPHRE